MVHQWGMTVMLVWLLPSCHLNSPQPEGTPLSHADSKSKASIQPWKSLGCTWQQYTSLTVAIFSFLHVEEDMSFPWCWFWFSLQFLLSHDQWISGPQVAKSSIKDIPYGSLIPPRRSGFQHLPRLSVCFCIPHSMSGIKLTWAIFIVIHLHVLDYTCEC